MIVFLAAGAFAAWARCLSLLIGQAHYPFYGALGAFLAGWILGTLAARKAGKGLSGEILFATGLFGLLCPGFIQFIGMNAGAAEYLETPLRHAWDALFIAGQAYLLVTFWAMGLAAALRADETFKKDFSHVFFWALAGPAAGYGLIRLAGPAAALAIFNAALLALGILKMGPRSLLKKPILSKAVAAALLIGLWSGFKSARAFKNIWLNRLNSAFPGGNFLLLEESGNECLGVYQFSSGAKILLSDGIAFPASGISIKHAVHIAFLQRPGSRNALLFGVRSPAALASASAYSIPVDAVDSHPAYSRVLQALQDQNAPLPEQLKITSKPGSNYDLIFMDFSKPLALTPLSSLTRRLNSEGILALHLPDVLLQSQPGALRATRRFFKHVSVCPLPAGRLILAGNAPLEADFSAWGPKITPAIFIDDHSLESYLKTLQCRDADSL